MEVAIVSTKHLHMATILAAKLSTRVCNHVSPIYLGKEKQQETATFEFSGESSGKCRITCSSIDSALVLLNGPKEREGRPRTRRAAASKTDSRS